MGASPTQCFEGLETPLNKEQDHFLAKRQRRETHKYTERSASICPLHFASINLCFACLLLQSRGGSNEHRTKRRRIVNPFSFKHACRACFHQVKHTNSRNASTNSFFLFSLTKPGSDPKKSWKYQKGTRSSPKLKPPSSAQEKGDRLAGVNV